MDSGQTQSDWDLVQASARGDRDAFHVLVDRYAADLLRLARSLSRTRADAEDVVQETFVGAYKGIAKFDGRASVRTWLSRILMRQAAKSWNKGLRERGNVSLSVSDGEPAGWRKPDGRTCGGSGEAGVDGRMDLQWMLAKLAEDHRQVIVLREIEGLSYAEMAEVIGVPQGTIESRLFRARAELRERLKDYVK